MVWYARIISFGLRLVAYQRHVMFRRKMYNFLEFMIIMGKLANKKRVDRREEFRYLSPHEQDSIIATEEIYFK